MTSDHLLSRASQVDCPQQAERTVSGLFVPKLIADNSHCVLGQLVNSPHSHSGQNKSSSGVKCSDDGVKVTGMKFLALLSADLGQNYFNSLAFCETFL